MRHEAVNFAKNTSGAHVSTGRVDPSSINARPSADECPRMEDNDKNKDEDLSVFTRGIPFEIVLTKDLTRTRRRTRAPGGRKVARVRKLTKDLTKLGAMLSRA